jgi:hypothetical protein
MEITVMNGFAFQHLSDTLNDFTLTSLQNDASDLVVLKWMLHELERMQESMKGVSTTNDSLHNQMLTCNRLQHEVTVYQPHYLDTGAELWFLSILGKKQRHTETYFGNIKAELVALPGIVSASFLTLPDGNTCHLMAYDGNEAQTSLQMVAEQKLSTNQFTQQYYKWVRLHSGSVRKDGVGQYAIFPALTRYYSFQQSSNMPLPGVLHTWNDHFRTTSNV